jgi:NADPH-dependent 2,4-dienoyl-CoA reductase/sulfur reductase-like enzyme
VTVSCRKSSDFFTSAADDPAMRNGTSDGIVIVGGGLAGQRCVETLRRSGYAGAIRLVCGESHLPYDRPPLSKELLAGTSSHPGPGYRPARWYEQQDIDALLGVSATKLDPVRRRITLSDRGVLSYSWVLIATGSRARTIPMLEGYDNVSTLRTLDDCQLLRDALQTRPRLAVVGGGFVGLEVASTARGLGVEVTMIEAAPTPLSQVLGPRMGEWFAALHRAEGVDVRGGCTVDGVAANGLVQGLHLSDGDLVPADHVVVGVGVVPDTDWLADSGLDCSPGIPVDLHGRTAVPHVLAAGDVAATFDPLSRRQVPGSHWEAAGRQGVRAARVMLGLDPGEAPVTSFWTDQYGIRIQYLGDARTADALEVDGAPESRSFTATFTNAGRAVAALLVNRPRALPAARVLIQKGTA